MPLWGNTDAAANSVKYATELTRSGPQGSGNANKAANNTALYGNATPEAFGSNAVVGQWAVTAQEFANTSAPDWNAITHTGWNMRYEGTGPVTGFTASGGTGFANGETVTVSNGSVNATGIVTANATGNLASVSVSYGGGGWANLAETAVTLNHEAHLSAITVSGTPTGYANTDTIVASNGTINATASVSTNSTGGFVTANVAITNSGLWPNGFSAGSVAFNVKAANGSASAGSGATFAATLANSSGGTVTVSTLGGRAGRVTYECIVAGGSITSTGNTIPAHT